jgi:hypothetical protein
MKNSILKSVVAILAGIVLGAILAILTDMIMEKSGLMKRIPFNSNSAGVILFVLFYRKVFNVSGSYLTARLAPQKPMNHALILGLMGFIVTLAGAIIMWNIPPHWYSLSVAFVSLPCSWFGGLLATRNTRILLHP